MAKSINRYLELHPGLERQQSLASARLRVDPSEKDFGYFPAEYLSAIAESVGLGNFSDIWPYSTNLWTETKDNSSTIAYTAGGLRFQGQGTPSANDDTAINGTRGLVFVQGKVYVFATQVQVSSVNATTGIGLTAGIVTNGSTELFAADPTDGVFFKMATGGGALIGRVVENGNAANDTGTLLTLSASTDYRLGFVFKAGASAADSFGVWYAGAYASETPVTSTGFTSAQTTAVYNMLATTAPTLSGHLGIRHTGTTQRNMIAQYCMAFADR